MPASAASGEGGRTAAALRPSGSIADVPRGAGRTEGTPHGWGRSAVGPWTHASLALRAPALKAPPKGRAAMAVVFRLARVPAPLGELGRHPALN